MEQKSVRVRSLGEFVGQSDIVGEIGVAIQSARTRGDAFPHLVMSGPPGLGKTTMAGIIAKEMGVPFLSMTASGVDSEEAIEQILAKFPTKGYNENTGRVVDKSKVVCPVLFMDEIHNLKRRLTELLHTVMEDWTVTLRKKDELTRKTVPLEFWVPKFTLIGATNYLGSLPRPFLDRFKLQIQFESYPDGDVEKVILNAAGKLGIAIDKDAVREIAMKSRGVPRIAIRFLEKARDVLVAAGRGDVVTASCVGVMFGINGVDGLALTRLDRKVLKYMAETVRPIGLASISQVVEEDESTVESTVEPWLVKQGLIIRTPQGRQITEAGMKHLGMKAESYNTSLHPLVKEES